MKPSLILSLFVACTLNSSLAGAQSLVSNGDFEQGLAGWTPFVPPESVQAKPSVTLTGEGTHSGSQAACISSDTFARHGIAAQSIPVVAGERYRLVAWLRAGQGIQVQPKTPGVVLRLTCLRKANGGEVPGGHLFIGLNNWVGHGLELPPAGTAMPTEWIKIDVVVEVPAGTNFITPTFFAWIARGAIYFDDISFEKISPYTPLTPVVVSKQG